MKKLLSHLFGLVIMVVLLSFQGCKTTGEEQAGPNSPSVWAARYEIQVPEGDISKQPKEQRAQIVMKREAILRSIVTEFGGVLIDQRRSTDYTHNPDGSVFPNVMWKITVDVQGDKTGENARVLRKRIADAFGATDVWITYYPVQKILN